MFKRVLKNCRPASFSARGLEQSEVSTRSKQCAEVVDWRRFRHGVGSKVNEVRGTAIQVRVQGIKKGFATDCLPSFSARRLEESGLSTSFRIARRRFRQWVWSKAKQRRVQKRVRFGAKLWRSPTPHPDWESRPRRPLVKFLGVGEGTHIP